MSIWKGQADSEPAIARRTPGDHKVYLIYDSESEVGEVTRRLSPDDPDAHRGLEGNLDSAEPVLRLDFTPLVPAEDSGTVDQVHPLHLWVERPSDERL